MKLWKEIENLQEIECVPAKYKLTKSIQEKWKVNRPIVKKKLKL